MVGFSGRTIKKGVEPKYLNTSTTQLFTKANVLYNFHQARILDPDRIILVEGFMDAIAYYRAGFKNAVATMGTALSEGHITSLHSLNNLKVVILSFDNDHAGIEATISNGQKLMEHGFKVYVVAKYDSNIKDVDELFRLQGQEAVNKILENRDDYFNFLINHIFSKKMPKDEIQIQAEKIIDSLVMFGDSSEILRMQILKSLAHKTNLEYEDLLNKLQHDLQKQLKTKDLKTQSRKPTKPTNNFGLNQNFIESVGEQEEIKQEVLTNYQKLVYGLKEEIALLNEKINRNYDEVISAVLTIPDSAKEISAELSYSVDFQYTGQRFIIKSILGLLRENKPVTQLTLLAFMEARKRNDEGYEKAIEYFLNFLNSEIHVSNKMLTKRNKKVMQGNHLAIQGHKYRRIIAENSLKMIELFRHKPFDENTRHTINEITLHNRAIEED